MPIVDAIVLGLIQGITEFLPISASGHLVIAREFLSTDATNLLAFDGVVHLATAAAVLVYFWSDIWTLIQSLLRKLSRLPVNEKDLTLFYALCVGTIPAVILGVIIDPFFKKDAQSAAVIAGLVFLCAIFFMYAEWRYYQRSYHGPVTVRRGFTIGLFQVLALLPGFSRLGVTLAGGMLAGMSRVDAARFSLLLALPIAVGVGSQKLLQLLKAGGTVEWTAVLVGSGVAFVVALCVIHFFLSCIKKYTLWPFIWYSVVLSCLVGYISFIG